MNTIDLLKKLVSIDSTFPNERRLSLFLSNYLKKTGFDVKHVITEKNRPNIVATLGKANRYLGFYGHMDTVPADSSYKFDPLFLAVKNNMAYGLGVSDMKGGIVAILKIAEHTSRNNLPVKIIFGVDEEDISQGAHDLVDSKLLDDIGFLIVAESGQVFDAGQPFSVVFGRKGRIVFDIEVFGKRAHAAEDNLGKNAIEQAATIIKEIKKIRFPKDKKLGSSEMVFQEISSQTDSFSIPDYCLIRCSLLTNSLTKSQDFINQIYVIAKKLDIKIDIKTHARKTPYSESYVVQKDKFLNIMVKNMFKPLKVKPTFAASVADENVFANRLNIPVISLGPTAGDSHTEKEWLSIPSLNILIGIYKDILEIY